MAGQSQERSTGPRRAVFRVCWSLGQGMDGGQRTECDVGVCALGGLWWRFVERPGCQAPRPNRFAAVAAASYAIRSPCKPYKRLGHKAVSARTPNICTSLQGLWATQLRLGKPVSSSFYAMNRRGRDRDRQEKKKMEHGTAFLKPDNGGSIPVLVLATRDKYNMHAVCYAMLDWMSTHSNPLASPPKPSRDATETCTPASCVPSSFAE